MDQFCTCSNVPHVFNNECSCVRKQTVRLFEFDLLQFGRASAHKRVDRARVVDAKMDGWDFAVKRRELVQSSDFHLALEV
jgi:hypothetical protein